MAEETQNFDDDQEDKKQLNRIFRFFYWIPVSFLLATATLYVANFGGLPFGDQTKFGEFGDYLGGVLNPIFSLFAILAIVMTIRFQLKELRATRQQVKLSREELELTREELKKTSDANQAQAESLKQQNADSTFFNLIGLYRSHIDRLRKEKHNGTLLWNYLKNFDQQFNAERPKSNVTEFRALVEKVASQTVSSEIVGYLMTIEVVLEYIDKKILDKEVYARFFTSQLLEDELRLICYYAVGMDYSLKPNLEKFGVFSALDKQRLAAYEISGLYKTSAFGSIRGKMKGQLPSLSLDADFSRDDSTE